MRSLFLLGFGILIGATALGAVWAHQDHGQIAEDPEVRIAVTLQEDGRTEVGLQQRQPDGAWGPTQHPSARFLPADANVGHTRYSSPVGIDVDTRADRAARAYRAELLTEGAELGGFYNGFVGGDDPDAEIGPLLCVVDTDDEGIGALCEGIAQTYRGAVDVLESGGNWDALRSELDTRFRDPNLAAFFPTSLPVGLLAADVFDELELEEEPPWVYWIELVEQHTAAPDTLICQVQHSGQVIATDVGLFWGRAAQVSTAAAAQLDVQLDWSAHNTAAAQAAMIRACAEHGAGAIATTLAEPDALSAAVSDAAAAGTPVVSFNSGAEQAESVGSAMHIGFDDREGGRLAGAEFNRQGLTGNVLCIIHEPNNVGLIERCDGFEEVYEGTVERWTSERPLAVVDEAEPTDAVAEILARLEAGDVDGILTLSVDGAWAARLASYEFDGEVSIGTFGFSLGLVFSVANGSVMFTINDHTAVQSYLAMYAAVMTERWRINPARYFNGMSILISPQLLDADYMNALIESMTRNE